MKSRYDTIRKIMIFWTLFIGIGAVAGSIGMFADVSGKSMGMDKMLPYFQKLPFADVLFTDFLFSGFALLIVNGLTNLTSAVLLFLKKKIGMILGFVFGITLMLWICIQFYMFPANFMSTVYFIFGFLQALTGYIGLVFYKQEQFKIDETEFTDIGSDPKKLVVYFSRMGYVKKQALIIANETGASVYQIKSTERTSGTLGFWWCGRFGMHKWDMPIEDIDIDISSYEEVTICTPVWVFGLCSPVRTFCKSCFGKIKKANYIIIHYTNSVYNNVAKEMDELLGLSSTPFKSIRCRKGQYKTIK